MASRDIRKASLIGTRRKRLTLVVCTVSRNRTLLGLDVITTECVPEPVTEKPYALQQAAGRYSACDEYDLLARRKISAR